MKLTLVDIENNGLIRVDADGNVTAADFDSTAKNPFEAVLGQNWAGKRVLLNLGKVNHIDSNGVGWLIQCQRTFKDGGGKLVVHSVQPMVKQVLDILKVGKVVPLADTLETARMKISEVQG